MATAMIYDTLKLAEQLEHEADFDPSRAGAMARSFAENVNGNLVTREDLLAFREDLLEKIGDVEGRIGGVEGRVIVLYWMAGVTLAGVVALWGITVAIIVALHISHSV